MLDWENTATKCPTIVLHLEVSYQKYTAVDTTITSFNNPLKRKHPITLIDGGIQLHNDPLDLSKK
jgi:hypothetical protein